jgi:hypothetical protein
MDILAFEFHVTGQEGAWSVRCSANGETSPESKLDLDLALDTALGLALQKIQDGNCAQDDLKLVGIEFWRNLISGESGAFFQKKRDAQEPDTQFHLRLNLPPKLHRLPWETLYDQSFGFLVCNSQYSILRAAPPEAQAPAFARRPPGPFRVLLIIPERSNLPAVESEVANLEAAVKQLDPDGLVKPLAGRVTPDKLLEQLDGQAWDVVHYIGHGDVDAQGNVTIRFLNEDGSELLMEAETFAALFTRAKVRLAVLNCCLGDSAVPNRTLSGLGPFLMRKKIPAVVAMRYEIRDTAASRFSKSFYQHLLDAQTEGRVDLAVDSARNALYLNHQSTGIRSFITPVLYLAPEWGQVFQFERLPLPPAPPPVPWVQPPKPAPAKPILLPPDLVDALKERRCIVVADHHLLAAGAVRSLPPLLGPRELAERLAHDPNDPYPQPKDLKLCDGGNDWLGHQLLQWVCTHRARDSRRGKLITVIQSAYEQAAVPEVMQSLAEWKVPALFYTYFDGLLVRACESARSSPSWQVFSHVSDKIKSLDQHAAGLLRKLVLVRGTIREDDSLVLTEEDHEKLWNQIGRIDRKLDAEVKRANRCVLFLGADPRDPLIHQLGQQILDSGQNRKQGPTYFVCPAHTATDEVYWGKYRVEWIHENLEAVIPQLSQSAI